MRRVLYSLNFLLGIVLLLIMGFSLVGCNAEADAGASTPSPSVSPVSISDSAERPNAVQSLSARIRSES